MKVETKIIIDEEDYNLLNGYIPVNPCKTCEVGMGCCGCDKSKRYNELIRPYRDAGLVDYAEIVLEMRRYVREIQKLQDSLESSKTKLKESGFDLNKIAGFY